MQADPAHEVAEQLLERWSDSETARELLRRQMAAMKADLLGPSPTTVERLVVDRLAICWLDAYVSERLAIRLDGSLDFSPAEKAYFQRTRDRAHRRYVECLKALSLIRARAIPALRLSVAVRDGASGSAAAAVVEAGGIAGAIGGQEAAWAGPIDHLDVQPFVGPRRDD